MTPIPAVFFNELLPQIDNLFELKVTLYAFWFLNLQEGQYRFVTWFDFVGDRLFMDGLSRRSEDATTILADALERAVFRGTLLKVIPAEVDEPQEALYFLNSARGRAAVRSLANHEWSPQGMPRAQKALEMERPNIFRLYEENIGALTPMTAEMLRDAERSFPEDWIEDAMRIAVANNVRRWRYIEAILKSWQEKGRDGTDRRDFEKDRRKYLEGDFAEFLEY